MKLDKHFKILKDGEHIGLEEAERIRERYSLSVGYVPIGSYTLNNPHYCIGLLETLKEKGLIDEYQYTGPDLPPIPSEPGVVY